jgi:hypothetical protein
MLRSGVVARLVCPVHDVPPVVVTRIVPEPPTAKHKEVVGHVTA